MSSHKAAAMILNEADILKTKMFLKSDVLNEPDFRIEQHQLQTMYHQVLVLDLEYALDKKVEQELWQVGFKHYITILQEIIRDKKNPRRSEAQALLTSCLQSASGFYLTLLQELYAKFNIPGPFKRKNAVYGQIYPAINSENVKLPRTSSCVYICQYCLVHLGDIARYMNKRKEAESFYKQAIKASPTSGHPYNQLALLEATQGDKLSTVFHYVRGIAVKNPFPATATNLANTLSTLIDKEEILYEIQTKMSVNDFIRLFLKAHGLLHTTINLEQADLCVKSINAALTALVATQSFTTDKLIKMTVINLYALYHLVGDNDELTMDEKKAKELILDLLSGSLCAFLLPVYTLKNDESLLDYYALPAIKLILCWINQDPVILRENVFTSKLQIWPSFCKLINNFKSYIVDFDFEKYEFVALKEDRELQGFLPLKESFKELDFKSEAVDESVQKHVRAKRLINFGHWLTNIDVNNSRLIIRKENENDDKVLFEPGCIQPDPTDKLLAEMKSIELSDKLKLKEKRGGILKPQGSLEKAREEREYVLLANSDSSNVNHISNSSNNASNNDLSKLKRVKQNVALQSIFKKIEENKQVKFSNEIADIEKPPKIKTAMKLPMNAAHLQHPIQQSVYNSTPASQPINQSNMQDILPFNMPSIPPISNSNIDYNVKSNSNVFPVKDNTHPQNVTLMQQQLFSKMLPSGSGNISSHLPDNKQPPFNQYPIDYNHQHRMFAPPERSVNSWNNDNSWWLQNANNYQQNNYMQKPQNFVQPQQQQYDPYQGRFQFPNMTNSMPHSSPEAVNIDMFNKPNHLQNDTWNSPKAAPLRNENVIGYNMNNMTVRQAMLNETKRMQSTSAAPPNFIKNASENNASMPGYSLFNPSSWTPNLPGQICGRFNVDNNARTQQSLFSNNDGSQSLKQLLEQQNQLSKDDT